MSSSTAKRPPPTKKRSASAPSRSSKRSKPVHKPTGKAEDVKALLDSWNSLRVKKLDDSERSALVDAMWPKLKNKVAVYSQRPDVSRVIQSCFKFGSSKIRRFIIEELTNGNIVGACKGKHSSFLVVSLFRYADGSAERDRLLKMLAGKVSSLGTHSQAARVVDFIFKKGVPPWFIHEFFGPHFRLWNANNDDDEVANLKNIQDLKIKNRVLDSLVKDLTKQADKGIFKFSYSQYLLWQFVSQSGSVARVKEVVPLILDACLALVATKQGARCVETALAVSDAKTKKKFLRSLKGHVAELSSHPYGRWVVMRALSCVDDTVLLSKTVVQELLDFTEEAFEATSDERPSVLERLIVDEETKVALWLLNPGDSRYFSDAERTMFDLEGVCKTFDSEEDKEAVRALSKKDSPKRIAEIRESVKSEILKICVKRASDLAKTVDGEKILTECVKTFGYSKDLKAALKKCDKRDSRTKHTLEALKAFETEFPL